MGNLRWPRRPVRGHLEPSDTGRGSGSGLLLSLALAVLACAAGLAQKLPCRLGAWETAALQYRYACYTDIYPLYFVEGLAEGKVPYLDYPVEYPVLIGAAMHLVARVVAPISNAYVAGAAFFDLTVVLLTVAALIAVAATVLVIGRRPGRAVMFAVAPGLALTAYINWDLLAVAFTALAVWSWSRRWPALAGALLGLGVATKFYPVVLLGPLFLLCLRARRLGAFARTAGTAAAAWVAVNLPVYLAAPQGWATFYTFSQERGAGWGSLWLLFQSRDTPLLGTTDLGELNLLATAIFLACCAGIAVLALSAPRRPRLAQLALLTLVAFVLTNKVWSPQYVLWLLPFAVLARPRWPAFLAWQATVVCYFGAIWYYLLAMEQPGAGIGAGLYFSALGLHAAGPVMLCAFVVREVLRPERDPVRADGDDDPAGGVLDGAADHVTLGRVPPPAGGLRTPAASAAN